MKKFFLLFLFIFSSYANSQTSEPICWGGHLPLNPVYAVEKDGEVPTLKTIYTAEEIEDIYKNILTPHISAYNSELYYKQYMCAMLWPYFTFVIKSTYTPKEFANATQAFIESVGAEDFIERYNLLEKIKMFSVVKGFNGKDKPNENEKDYVKFSAKQSNLVFIDLMNSNEKVFFSLKTYLTDKDKTLKNLTIEDLFNTFISLKEKKYIDMGYFPNFKENETALLTELKKINN